MRIEEASARRQARIDSGEETIVGVRIPPRPRSRIDILNIDRGPPLPDRTPPATPRRARRSPLPGHPQGPHRVLGGGAGNLLALAIECAQARASLGEISDAMDFHSYKAVVRWNTIWGKEFSHQGDMKDIPDLIQQFESSEGRRPRVVALKWARTAMFSGPAAPRWSPPPMRTWACRCRYGPLPNPPRKPPSRPSKTTSMSSP